MDTRNKNTMRLILVKRAVSKLEKSVKTLEMTQHIDWNRFVEDIIRAVEAE